MYSVKRNPFDYIIFFIYILYLYKCDRVNQWVNCAFLFGQRVRNYQWKRIKYIIYLLLYLLMTYQEIRLCPLVKGIVKGIIKELVLRRNVSSLRELKLWIVRIGCSLCLQVDYFCIVEFFCFFYLWKISRCKKIYEFNISFFFFKYNP